MRNRRGLRDGTGPKQNCPSKDGNGSGNPGNPGPKRDGSGPGRGRNKRTVPPGRGRNRR